MLFHPSEIVRKPSAAADRIRIAGAKVTRNRTNVLELLSVTVRPLSHGDMEMALASKPELSMDRVTLYRVLDLLVAKGLVLKAVDAHGVFRYTCAEGRQQHEGHVHFHCLGCGGMFCLSAKPPLPPRLPRGFRLSEIEYDVRGTCPDCADASPVAGLR